MKVETASFVATKMRLISMVVNADDTASAEHRKQFQQTADAAERLANEIINQKHKEKNNG